MSVVIEVTPITFEGTECWTISRLCITHKRKHNLLRPPSKNLAYFNNRTLKAMLFLHLRLQYDSRKRLQRYELFKKKKKIIFPEGTFCHRGKGWLLDIGKVGQHGGHDTLYQRDVFFGCEQHHLGINLEVMMGYLVPHSHHARPVQLRVTGKEFAM